MKTWTSFRIILLVSLFNIVCVSLMLRHHPNLLKLFCAGLFLHEGLLTFDPGDSDSKSEIVVPIKNGRDEIVAILDIDCAVVGGFSDEDREGLEKLASFLGRACDW